LNIYVKDLVALSNVDKELDQFKPKIEELQNKVITQESIINDLISQKEAIEKEIEENQIKIASFEEQIKELKAQLEDIKRKSGEAKNEKEIFALQTEEHIAKDKLTYANEEIDRLNKVNEVKKSQLEELQAQIEQKQKELEEIKKEVNEEFKKIDELKAELIEKREEIISNMDRRILAFYEKIRKWAGNSAVVKVQNQACYGCYMKINDKAYSDLINGEDIVTCPHCGRVLYIELEEAKEA
jgi:predicted  nucleic acid-binding Zn-ribbon protein